MPPESATRTTDVITADLKVRPGSDAGSALAIFRFDHGSKGWETGLERLGGDLEAESWQVPGTPQSGAEQDIVWRLGGGLCFLSAQIPDDGTADMAALTEDVYDRLLTAAQTLEHPWLLRVWNFISAINTGSGDAERYRQFCVGRSRALERQGGTERQLCAGSAIGGEQPWLRIYALCGRKPGRPVENPRQVPAWRYPRSYGPRSPSFARATAVAGTDGAVTLLISGTASVVGHATAHVGDVDGQLKETVRNLEALLEQSAREFGRPALARLNADSLLHVYVRDPSNWPRIRDFLELTWPQARLVALRGDICRDDLLVEIEAVHKG